MAATPIRWCRIWSGRRSNSPTRAAASRCASLRRSIPTRWSTKRATRARAGRARRSSLSAVDKLRRRGADPLSQARPGSGLPVADTDTRADWAQDPADIVDGRKAQYPGWELERFFAPRVVTGPATCRSLSRPTTPLRRSSAAGGRDASIRFEGYTFENARLGELIAARARAGVQWRCCWKAARRAASAISSCGSSSRSRRPAGASTTSGPTGRRHPRPLHLSARQVLGAGWPHGADRQREPQRRGVPRR